MNHKQIAERIIGNLGSVSSPAVSPDGRHVAFVATRTDLAENRYESQIWLARTDGSSAARRVSAGQRAGSPAWSPDGSLLAFVSGRAEKKSDTTLHILPVGAPGEVLTIATMPDGLGEVTFSPDGLWLAFTSRTQDERYRAKDERWQAPRKIERYFSRLNGEGFVVDRPNHVYVVPADGSAAPRNLTPGPHQHSGIAWLKDSSGVVTVAERHDTWDLDLSTVPYRIGLDGKIKRLTPVGDAMFLPSVSPGGSTVAVIGTRDPWTEPHNAHVGLLPSGGLAKDRSIRWISTGLDRTFAAFGSTRPPVWVDDDTLLCTAEDHGNTHLYRLSADGSDPQPLTSGPLSVTGYDAAGGCTVVTVGRVDQTGDVYVLEGSGELRALTSFGQRSSTALQPQPWEKFTVRTKDRRGSIDAWIMRPTNFKSGKKYPVLLNVHGGPFTQYGERYFDEAQMQAAAGFVVLMCNPRGGSGRDTAWGTAINGPQHRSAPAGGWGTVDVDDVLSVVDAALKTYSFCDAKRVGMLGGSYGGYMATWLAGTTGTKFKAICSERAVNNMLSMDWTSDIATAFRGYVGVDPWTDPTEWIRMSPIHKVAAIKVPMLIIHSEDDLRCPISQAEELFIALRTLGKPVDFYRFPAESHELSRSGSPVHRVQRAEIILDWFAKHL